MSNFTNDDYVNMKANGKEIFKDSIHSDNVKKQMEEEWTNIRNFPYQSYKKIREWQLKRISYLVDYAYENIPLYRKKYDEIGFKKGDIKTWRDYNRLPILTKEELINGFPNDIAANLEDFNISTRSSGSSGKFVTIAVSKEAIYTDTIQGFRQYYLQTDNRYNPNDTVLFIYTCPWWITEVDGQYKSEFLPTTTKVEDAIKKIKELRPKIISTYPTYLEKISSTGIDLSEYGVDTVIVHSEQSSRSFRAKLEKELNVKIVDEYSSEEMTRIALECPHHTYHLEEDACYVEALDPKTFKKVKPGEPGILVGTNLLNTSTPIIKYNQGDLVILDKPTKCECKNKSRTMKKIQGRLMDSIMINKNEYVPASSFMDIAYNWFLEFNIPVHGLRYQFVQYEPDELTLYLIKGYFELDLEIIKNSIYLLIPKKMKLKIELVDEFPKIKGEKYRPVINLCKGDK